jgi:hypothetical protein
MLGRGWAAVGPEAGRALAHQQDCGQYAGESPGLSFLPRRLQTNDGGVPSVPRGGSCANANQGRRRGPGERCSGLAWRGNTWPILGALSPAQSGVFILGVPTFEQETDMFLYGVKWARFYALRGIVCVLYPVQLWLEENACATWLEWYQSPTDDKVHRGVRKDLSSSWGIEQEDGVIRTSFVSGEATRDPWKPVHANRPTCETGPFAGGWDSRYPPRWFIGVRLPSRTYVARLTAVTESDGYPYAPDVSRFVFCTDITLVRVCAPRVSLCLSVNVGSTP